MAGGVSTLPKAIFEICPGDRYSGSPIYLRGQGRRVVEKNRGDESVRVTYIHTYTWKCHNETSILIKQKYLFFFTKEKT
jgi:hypothetical protein